MCLLSGLQKGQDLAMSVVLYPKCTMNLHVPAFAQFKTLQLLVLYDQWEEIMHLLFAISSSELINVWCCSEAARWCL